MMEGDTAVGKIFVAITIMNCFLYNFLWNYFDDTYNLVDHPFIESVHIIFGGTAYSLIGLLIGGICPYYSTIVLNAVLMYVSYLTYLQG